MRLGPVAVNGNTGQRGGQRLRWSDLLANDEVAYDGDSCVVGATMSLVGLLLLLAMLATAAVLAVGLAGFFIGGPFNEKYGNRLMRARVGLQLLAVILLGLLFMMQG
jgi:hypothetical protein